MHQSRVYLLMVGGCAATFLSQQDRGPGLRKSSFELWLDQDRPHQRKFTVPSDDDVPWRRNVEIEKKRHGYLYGPSLLGNTSYFPTGTLGNAMVQQHIDQWLRDASWITAVVGEEANATLAALEKASNSGGLNEFDDYRVLYENQWERSVPGGIAQGAFQNATQDLLLSMERLSVNPYGVRRLHPTADIRPFEVDPTVPVKLAGTDIEHLHRAGRLFYIDHGYQAAYPTAVGRYTAACSAYFFIHPTTGDFLPLAIKTNVGSNLTYTPLDTKEDWLLAKAMFNMNDLFHAQIYHLANSHAICEVVHLAALRTLSSSHPVLGLLERLMHQAYAIRPIGEKFLFNNGGYFDQSFAITNQGVRMFATEFYPGAAGPFQANYFHADLVARGLLNCTYGPALKSFPFFEDASVLHGAIHRFMVSFVDVYYATEDSLVQDEELRSWIEEATSEALVIDFPSASLIHKEAVVGILTHIAFLAGVSHHVLNGGEPVTTSGILPLHPSAIYAPLPIAKGIRDLMPYLTPADEAVKHIALLARFNRPQLGARNDTLIHMFSSGQFLEKCTAEVDEAAADFQREMKAFSDRVRNRRFNAEGLSQGMPFIWQALDPSRLPYFLSV